MTRRVATLTAPLLLAAALVAGCSTERGSTPTSPSTTTTTTTTTTGSGGSSSYMGVWSSNAVSSISVDKCANFQWKITSQTATSIAGDFSVNCGIFSIAATGSGTLNGQAVSLAVSGTVSGGGAPLCSFALTGNGTITGDTLPLTYSGTTCLGPVSGTEVLRKGSSSISINAPTPVSPARDASVSSTQPTLVVTNSTRTGNPESVAYRFQVTTDGTFSTGVMQWQVPEGSGQTSLTIPQALSNSTGYYWRVQGYYGSTESPWSTVFTFNTPASGSTPPPSSPPGADQLDMSRAAILNSPSDLASWPITTALEVVDMGPGGISVQFSKKDGPGRWPDVTPPGWDGPLQYTLGMCMTINNRWYCSAVVEFWYGLDRSGGPPQDYAMNWFYDPVRWAPMTGHQPAVGETIGIFVCAGDCRNNTKGTLSPVAERSNVVLVRQPPSSGAVYRF